MKNTVDDPGSIFEHYQKLIRLRKEYDVITYGDYHLLLADDPHVFMYKRKWKDETLVVVSNFYAEEVNVALPFDNGDDIQILLSNYPDTETESDVLTLRAYESVIYFKK